MRTGVRLSKFVLFLFLGLSVIGCPSPTTQKPASEDEEDTDTGTVEEDSTLFEPVDGESGSFVFQTNDTAYSGAYGYTFWARTGETQTPFIERETVLSKISGDGTAGYGVVICHGTTSDASASETMIAVMINNSREYIVGEVVGSDFTAILPWTESTYLKKGQNQANTVRVTLESGTFTLYLNGNQAATFRDDDAPLHTGGDDGLIVVISPNDDFPDTPVHVTFEEL